MQESGQRLRRAREHLKLRYRDVEKASQNIADQYGNHEFVVGLSRLADIENKGTVPSIYRLYSLCAIYRLGFNTVLQWYGIELEKLLTDAVHSAVEPTFPFDLKPEDGGYAEFPAELAEDFDFRRTSYLGRQIERWGKLPLSLLTSLDLHNFRYAFVGTDDWSMHPIIPPGSFVQVDEGKRRIAKEGWTDEYERPIYLVEHRNGYRCGWCSQKSGYLVVQAHPTFHEPPSLHLLGEAEIVGQVVGVAKRLDLAKRRRTRS